MKKKPILLGQAPARSGDGRPFTGPSGQRIQQMMGLPDYEMLAEVFELRNLVGSVQLKNEHGKGDAFPKQIARTNWFRMSRCLEMDFVLLCAGREVAKIVGVGNMPFLHLATKGLGPAIGKVAVVPHPSGISLWWNDPENVARARIFFAQFAPAQ